MDILLFNTLGRKKQKLEPLEPGRVGVYTCGPTVYDRAHIGNLRSYIFADSLRRVLEYNGLKVKHVMNITDVGHLMSDADEGEDKMEVAARERGKSPWEIAEEYTKLFFKDSKKLNILRPNIVVRATDHIGEMIEYTKQLLNNGYAYEIDDGLYYDISKYPEYGQLSGTNLEEQLAGARVAVNRQKRNPHDFAVWKKAPREHIMQWDSPWGMGYPGWHLECSVLSQKYLGDVFDIHTGGVDHIPIHHENEIAQSIGCTGKIPAKIWMHAEFLQVDRGKMSKSLGNVYNIDDLEERGFEPLAFRYLCLNSHYRKQLNFTWEVLEGAQTALRRLRKAAARLCSGANAGPREMTVLEEYQQEFLAAINDDLNLPQALAVVWNLVRDAKPGPEVCQLLKRFDSVLALDLLAELEKSDELPELPAEVMAKIRAREEARASKNWAKADRIRDELLKQGIRLIDTKDGTRWELIDR